MQEVWRRPAARALADLKECLDFGTAAWIGLFARLGGAELLLQVCRDCGEACSFQHILHWQCCRGIGFRVQLSFCSVLLPTVHH